MHGGTVAAASEARARGASSPSACRLAEEPPRPPRTDEGSAPTEARARRSASWSSTTTWTPPGALARLLKLLGHEVAGRPRRPDGHRGAPGATGPTSCSSTSACPGWTATRSPAPPAGGVLQGRRHHRRLRLRPGGGPPPLAGGGLRPPPRQARRLRRVDVRVCLGGTTAGGR